MRRVPLIVFVVLLCAVAATPVLAAPGITVETTRAGMGGVPVFAPPIVTRRGVVQPPVAAPGQYFIVTGVGFAPNAPVTAALTMTEGGGSVPLMPADLLAPAAPAPAPTTDATGAFPAVAFQVPPASGVTGRGATLAVTAGPGAVAGVPVVLDVPLPNETAGDTLVVGSAVLFYLAAAVVAWLLIRRPPRMVRAAATNADDAA